MKSIYCWDYYKRKERKGKEKKGKRKEKKGKENKDMIYLTI
jgi:hypothetical protein